MSPLVSAKWLKDNLDNPNLVLLDASIDFQIPTETEKDKVNLIPNSRRFDYDSEFCDPNSALPHMMPSEARFNALAQALGINNSSLIVVYDNAGTFASPRAYWMFKAMGHQEVVILNGGLTAWKAQGYTVTQSYLSDIVAGDFEGQYQGQWFVDADYVEQQIDAKDSTTIDARGKPRFLGTVAEPREGVRAGHIPNSVCLPFAELIDGHQFKAVSDIEPLLHSLVTDRNQQIIFSCGSGVTACILSVAAQLCGYHDLRVYDGSWTEWGQDHNRPIA